VFVVRPAAVWASTAFSHFTNRERALLGWAGLRGAVPIVLATIPFAERVTDSERLFDIVFVMVVIMTLLTGPTLPWVARRLGVTRQLEPRSLDLEVAPLERVAADLLQVTISSVSQLHGVEVGELRLPEGSLVSMVVRDGRAFVPERRTVLRRGDDLLVVTPRGLRESTVQRLRTVSAHGRLGRWLGE
jgi:potassium/hydrogen antiporter